jgi:hypothetical protein
VAPASDTVSRKGSTPDGRDAMRLGSREPVSRPADAPIHTRVCSEKFFSINDLPCDRTGGFGLIVSVKTTKRITKNARQGTAPAGETRETTRARCKGERRASPKQSHQSARPDGFDEALIDVMKAALHKHKRLSVNNVLHCAVWRLLLDPNKTD